MKKIISALLVVAVLFIESPAFSQVSLTNQTNKTLNLHVVLKAINLSKIDVAPVLMNQQYVIDPGQSIDYDSAPNCHLRLNIFNSGEITCLPNSLIRSIFH